MDHKITSVIETSVFDEVDLLQAQLDKLRITSEDIFIPQYRKIEILTKLLTALNSPISGVAPKQSVLIDAITDKIQSLLEML